MNKIESSLTETIRTSDLQKVSVDLAEILVDSMINDGVFKDIPILGSIVGLGKTASTIKDTLFLKKIIHFLTELKGIPAETTSKND
ncbi:MAG: hypothetical protein U5Q03_00655 [Bacteroidota bacterium]|nr:hypothetical protein [Bacteroidota bacterium]